MFVYNVHTTVLHHSNIQCYMSLTFTAVQLCELSFNIAQSYDSQHYSSGCL